MYLPKFSIVIPNLNGGKFLEEAILSALEQDYPNFEIIVVDGGSSDNSLDIVRKYAAHISHWESKPDRGQAHAINKGLEMANGDLFDWLNSDDRIAPGTFWKVAKVFEADSEAFVVCGFMAYFYGEKHGKPVRMTVFDRLEDTLIFGSMSGPSMYFRLDKFRETGKLEEQLHYCFDMEFWYRFVEKHGVQRLRLMDDSLCDFRLHEASKTFNSRANFIEEQYLIQHSIVQSFPGKKMPALSPELLGIETNYSRFWDFPTLNPILFSALAIQRHLDLLNERLSISAIFHWYFLSFRLAPLHRNWRFYLLPFRVLNWKLRLFPKRLFPI